MNQILKVKAINDDNKDIENVVYTIKYDSINGKLANDIYVKKILFLLIRKKLNFFQEKN